MKPHSFRLSQLCETVGGELIGEDIEISGAAGIDEATDTDITFLRQNRPIEALENCEAGAVCIAPGHADPGRPAIRHANPRYVFGMALPLLVPSDTPDAGVHATALVHESATLGEGVCIGAYAIVESDAVVGDRTVISAHAVIERRAMTATSTREQSSITTAESATDRRSLPVLLSVAMGSASRSTKIEYTGFITSEQSNSAARWRSVPTRLSIAVRQVSPASATEQKSTIWS